MSQIVVENPVEAVREKALEIAQKVLQTDPTNITMSQWQVEAHDEEDTKFVACCAINRRLDPMKQPFMLHIRAQDYDHLKMMFHYVEYLV